MKGQPAKVLELIGVAKMLRLVAKSRYPNCKHDNHLIA